MKSFSLHKEQRNHTLGKMAYGTLFVVIAPMLIILWGEGLDGVLKGFPSVGTSAIGWALVAAGFAPIIAGWWALYRYGEGLPMNVFPPKRLVLRGIYSIIPHPIYFGFTVMTAGYFIAVRSGAGFWLVTPILALGATALVQGYERPDMKKRFGSLNGNTLIRIPSDEDSMPTPADRASAYLLVFLPWLALYEAAIFLGPAPDAVESFFSFEYALPVIEWTEAIYGMTYFFVCAVPLVARRRSDLRKFMSMGVWATIAGGFCFFLFPLSATPRPFQASGLWGELLLFERSIDSAAGAFPSFHVIWSLLAAWLYSRSFGIKSLWYLFASAIALSCITTGMHSLLDVLAALAVFIVVLNSDCIWQWTLKTTERIANSWQERRIGQARIIVHGAYAGAGAFLGVIVAAHLAGASQLFSVLLVSFSALIGAGLWGQAVEGSSKLSRPFGYYGAILGGGAGILTATAFGADGWLLAGAFGVSAPFVQATGRLRCLVQGCCHGRECGPGHGICFTHERSRVLYLAGLGHKTIYPTQLYSIIYNLVLGALLIRTWTLSAPMPFIAGVYLLLGGLGRFIEESYRGEPQTPRYAGLAMYHWLALTGVIIGAILTTVDGKPCNTPVRILPWAFGYSAIFGIVAAFAMGVDFPDSKKRFSRLA